MPPNRSQIKEIDDRVETRGRKCINADGEPRKGRYVKCSHCAETFYWDYKNLDTRADREKIKYIIKDKLNSYIIE